MMTPFLLKVTVTELGYLVLLPALSLIGGLAASTTQASRFYQILLSLTAFGNVGVAFLIFQEIYWAGAYNEMDISGETGARLIQDTFLPFIHLSASPFETLLLTVMSLLTAIYLFWQYNNKERMSFDILFRQNILWLGILLMILSSTLVEIFFLYLLGSILILWQKNTITKPNTTTWLFL